MRSGLRWSIGRLAPVCLLLLSLGLLAGCDMDAGPLPAAGGRVGALGFAVVGDSLTAGVGGRLTGTDVEATGSWLPAAIGEPLVFRGGWAVSGATTADMLAGVQPVDAAVVVVLAGTNDVAGGVDWATSRGNLLDVVAAVGIDDVLVLAIPPLEGASRDAVDYDRRLADLATDQGWQYLDPWTEVTEDDQWAPGTSSDGVHPTQGTADEVGAVIRGALLARLAEAVRDGD